MSQSSVIQFSMRRVLAAVAAAFFVAAGFVQFDWAPQAAPSASLAGEAMMRMLRDEHAVIADYLKDEAQARTQADLSAARDLERMKLVALDEGQPTGLRLAQAATTVREEKAKASIVRVAVRPEPVRVMSPAVGGEPMQLLAMTDMRPMPAPRATGLVRGRLHQLASTVERIPSWFNSAAGWVVGAVPVPRMPSLPPLPMRHFRV